MYLRGGQIVEENRNEAHTEAAAAAESPETPKQGSPKNPGGKTGKKKGKLLIGGIAAAAGIIVLTAVIWYNLPKQRFDRQMTIGSRYLDNMDYEDAVLAFTTALEILPKEESATGQLESAYVAWGDSYSSEGDYENAVNTLGKAKAQLPESTAFEEPLEQTYVAWADSYSASGDYASAVSTLGKAKAQLPESAALEEPLVQIYVAWADSCSASGDYASAVNALGQGKEQLPESTAFEDPLAQAYVDWGNSSAKSGDYKKATDILKEGLGATGENSKVRKVLTNTYLKWTESLVESGDLEGAKKVIGEAADVVPSDDVTKEQTDVNDRIQEREILKEAGEIQEVTDTTSVDDVAKAADGVTKFLTNRMDDLIRICDDHDGTYADPKNGFGVYNIRGQYYLYLGEFNGNARQGHALWLQFYRNTDNVPEFVRFDGEWEHDLPNGSMVQTYSAQPNKMVGNVVNGLWEGEVYNTIPNQDTGELATFIETYYDGKLDILRSDGDSDAPYACAVAVDNPDRYMWYPEEVVNATYGVGGF